MKYQNSFRKLIAWQEAKNLTIEIYNTTQQFPKAEQYGLTDQLRRSSNSIMANIAEGNGRKTKKDILHYFTMARGSLTETDSHLELAKELKYLDNENYKKLIQQLNKTAYLLWRLSNSQNTSQ